MPSYAERFDKFIDRDSSDKGKIVDKIPLEDVAIDTYIATYQTWMKITHKPTGISVQAECINGRIKTRKKLMKELEVKVCLS